MKFNKPKRDVHTVFIHCSASDNILHDDVSVIRQWHLNLGWNDVGYHFFIQKDGTIQKGRDIEKTPAAQYEHNKGSIAICLHGLEIANFTQKQYTNLINFCEQIYDAYDGSIKFRGHNEVANKTCPVINYRELLSLNKEGIMKKFKQPIKKEIVEWKVNQVTKHQNSGWRLFLAWLRF